MLLNGKTLVVTGGNSGIGEAIVKAAAAQGANVVIDYIAHADETAEIVAEIEQLGGHAVGVQADVSRTADLHKMVRTAVDTYGRLDALLNNAGIETRAGILDTTEADYERVMAINLKSAFFGTQFAAKSSSPRATAASPSTSPRSTRIGRCPANIAYCISKGGTRMLARTAGVELGPHGIRIVNVCPGAVATPINQSTMDDPGAVVEVHASSSGALWYRDRRAAQHDRGGRRRRQHRRCPCRHTGDWRPRRSRDRAPGRRRAARQGRGRRSWTDPRRGLR